MTGGTRPPGGHDPGRERQLMAAADPLIRMALDEDVRDGDRTSLWTVPADAEGEAVILAREPGVVCGVGVVERVFATVDRGLRVVFDVGDGGHVSSGDRVVAVSGSLCSILTAERTALNFLARLSGVATLTARYVEAVGDLACRIADTRKTTPGWRVLEKYAVATGGGLNHRSGLYDMVLIKENHIRAAGGVSEAVRAARAGADREDLDVEVEVTDEAELLEALACGPDRVMLDNMTLDELRAAVAMIRSRPGPHPLIEASGGVKIDTVRDIAGTGVDYIYVGALTTSARDLDYSLLVNSA
jgi:nicotinate-nucleotide pyrophosphorylase (carboxylating)